MLIELQIFIHTKIQSNIFSPQLALKNFKSPLFSFCLITFLFSLSYYFLSISLFLIHSKTHTLSMCMCMCVHLLSHFIYFSLLQRNSLDVFPLLSFVSTLSLCLLIFLCIYLPLPLSFTLSLSILLSAFLSLHCLIHISRFHQIKFLFEV